MRPPLYSWPMSQAVGDPRVLPYSTPELSALSPRRWRHLLWLGVAHLVVMVALIGISVPGVLMLVGLLAGEPWRDWFIVGLVAHNASIPIMMLANALAVAGYAAAVRGRSPRRWFLLYVPTELALMALQYGLLLLLTGNSPLQTSRSSSVGVSGIALFIMPAAYVILNLPLFLLLFPRIRRACFAG